MTAYRCTWTGKILHLVIVGTSLSEPHTSELNSGFFIYIYILLSVVRHSVNAACPPFNAHARVSVQTEYRKERVVQVSSTLDPFHFSILDYKCCWTWIPSANLEELPNQRRSKKTGNSTERDRAQRDAETAEQTSESLRELREKWPCQTHYSNC